MNIKKSTIYELEFDVGIISENEDGLEGIDIIKCDNGTKEGADPTRIEDAIDLIEELELETGSGKKDEKEFVIIGKIVRRYDEYEK